MPILKVYNQKGEAIKDIQVSDKVFASPIKPVVVQQAVEVQQANSRTTLAHTKTRAEVRGGGKKPWKQKGTGRARHGSTRSPIWVGGGITFGPRKERNFSKSINKTAKKSALRMVLTDKFNHQNIVVVDELDFTEPKTKQFLAFLKNLPISKPSVLVALNKKQENVIKSVRNLPKITALPSNSLNIVDLLKYEYLLITEKAVLDLSKSLS